MQISPSSHTIQDLQLSAGSKAQLSLRTGEIVQAEVLTVTDTAVAIRMKNTVVEARATLPLREGDTILLKVESGGHELRLRLIPREGDDIASLKNTILSALAALKSARPAADDLKLLSALMKNMPVSMKRLLPELQVLDTLLPSLEGITDGLLKHAVRDSGVFLESKLRLMVLQGRDDLPAQEGRGDAAHGDLKAALTGLRNALARSDVANALARSGEQPSLLAGAVDNLLRNIEVRQLQSRLNDTLQVFLPFVWQDLKEGELVFRESGREHRGGRAYSCTLNLDLERAGKLSAWALLQPGGLHIHIAAENERFADLLRDNAVVLKGQFAAAGLLLGSLTIQQPGAADFTSAHAGGLDIRI